MAASINVCATGSNLDTYRYHIYMYGALLLCTDMRCGWPHSSGSDVDVVLVIAYLMGMSR